MRGLLAGAKLARISMGDARENRQGLEVIAGARCVVMIGRPQVDAASGDTVIRIGVGNAAGDCAVEGLPDGNDPLDGRDCRANSVVSFADVERHAPNRLPRPALARGKGQGGTRPCRYEAQVNMTIVPTQHLSEWSSSLDRPGRVAARVRVDDAILLQHH